MSFFSNVKNLFSASESKPPLRRLSHPRDLRTGDIIKFQHLGLSDISNSSFEISQINTYIYGDLCYPELVLKDKENNIIFIMVEEEDGEEYLAISRKIPKARMNDVIAPEDLPRILTRGTGTEISIPSKPEGFEEWLADRYKETDDNIKGAFVVGDARYLSDAVLDKRAHFTSHILEDSTETYALEVEIYDSGEHELCVTVYHDISDIDEMWPSTKSDIS